jgi:hypothetical protein
MPGNRRETARIVADEWRKAGMSEAGIAGLMANVREESNFDPTLRHYDQPGWTARHGLSEPSYAHGLYQEGADEWIRYDSWLKKNYPGANWRDPKLQSEFAAWNLRANYPRVWQQMMVGTKEQAAEAHARGYLKPQADYLASRVSKFRRGIPGTETYTGPMTRDVMQEAGALHGPALRRHFGHPPKSSLDLLDHGRRSGIIGPQTIKGDASLRIDLNGFPRGTRTRTEATGMFRDVQLTRARSMALASEEA